MLVLHPRLDERREFAVELIRLGRLPAAVERRDVDVRVPRRFARAAGVSCAHVGRAAERLLRVENRDQRFRVVVANLVPEVLHDAAGRPDKAQEAWSIAARHDHAPSLIATTAKHRIQELAAKN